MKDGSSGEWNKFIDTERTKIYYFREPNRNLYSFYCEKQVDAPMFNVVPIIAEAQTFKDWIPLLYKSEITHELSHFRKMGEFCV